jgi:hypothetical protein
MANETNFFSKKLLLWREATKGVTPATIAKAYSLTALSFSLTETQKTEQNPALGNGGQGSATDFGASDYAGNVECKYTGGIMPILVNHVIGTATKTDATASTWTATTVTTAGNMVNSVAGTASLVCKTAGTTGATEPSYVGKVDGDLITDGTVVWTYRSAKLKKYVGTLSPCLETLGVEMQSETGCGTVVSFKERFTGVFLNSLEIAKSGGNVVYKYSIPAIAMGHTDSAQTGFTSPTITSELAIVDNSFGYDDATITIGGVEPTNANSFRITINRNTGLEYGVKVGERIDNTPIVTVDGELKLKMTLEQYTALYANPTKAIVVTLSKVNGDKAMFTFANTETMRSPLEYATDKPIYLTSKLNAKGSAAVSTVSYEVISTTDW